MPLEAYRLCRLLPSESASAFDYLSCYRADDSYEFTLDPDKALLFRDWNSFVEAACSLWRSQGPMDIVYERVFVLPRRSVSHA